MIEKQFKKNNEDQKRYHTWSVNNLTMVKPFNCTIIIAQSRTNVIICN